MLKIVQKSIKDYIVASNRAVAPPNAGAAPSAAMDIEAEKKLAESILVLSVSLLLHHLFHADTQLRKPIAQVVALVADQVTSIKVLEMMCQYIGSEIVTTSKKKSYVPPRDKATLFAKVR